MQLVHVSETALEELLFFAEEEVEQFKNEELFKKPSMALLMKRSSENLPNTIDDVVAQMVYGNHRKPPGDENCPYRKLLTTRDNIELPGVWAPTNSLCKAMGLKWLFPNISGPYKLPEVEPVPPHVIIAYDAFKYKEVMELGNQFPTAIMKYGFFSNHTPGMAQLITKTVDKFEKQTTPPTYEEKIVVQLAKSYDWFDAFYDLGPSYASPDTVQGAEEAKLFFPPTYDIPEDIIMEIKKKPKKKIKSKFVAVVEAHEEKLLQGDVKEENDLDEQTSEDNVEGRQFTEEKATEMEEEEEEDEEGGEEIVDKATSPMDDAKEEEANEP